jgi:SAM-dependent methyltransferase
VKRSGSIPKPTNTSNGLTIKDPYIAAYGTKEVSFKFRSRDYHFSLSHGLFSSADIDSGSRFLLKVFSRLLDEDLKTGSPVPRSVLDAGCGVGVLGICAAGALADAVSPSPEVTINVKGVDRDELARVFTEYNARRNGIPGEIFSAFTGPLLAGPQGQKWDLILTNIPAKAGVPVLEDFIRRSAAMLSPGGRVCMVTVNTLTDFFRSLINGAASPVYEEKGPGHTVFVYGPLTAGNPGALAKNAGSTTPGAMVFDEGFPETYPFYIRNRDAYEIEDIRYHLDTVYGAPDFDSPCGAAAAAAKLAVKLDLRARFRAINDLAGRSAALLIHEPGQGHFAVWLALYLRAAIDSPAGNAATCRWVLSGRNILALGAARRNTAAVLELDGVPERKPPVLVLAADLFFAPQRAAATAWGKFTIIAAFPETTPGADRRAADWEGLADLAAPGGIVIIGLSSAGAERFDRIRSPGFIRLGDIKRKGFRALAYRKT